MLRRDWDPAKAAVVICDMWDAHHCVSAADRVAEMAPRMNEVIAGLREQGASIIHPPADYMDFYSGTTTGRPIEIVEPRDRSSREREQWLRAMTAWSKR